MTRSPQQLTWRIIYKYIFCFTVAKSVIVSIVPINFPETFSKLHTFTFVMEGQKRRFLVIPPNRLIGSGCLLMLGVSNSSPADLLSPNFFDESLFRHIWIRLIVHCKASAELNDILKKINQFFRFWCTGVRKSAGELVTQDAFLLLHSLRMLVVLAFL